MTEIKLSPAMVTALKGATIEGAHVRVSNDTKGQTVKGLETRGLTDDKGYLTPEGVEAARQLGNDTTTYNQPVEAAEKPVETTEGNPAGITPEMVQEAAQNLLKAVDLDKPEVVPNREDKRKSKFQLRGALSRLNERRRVKRMKKYGSVPSTFAA